MGAGAEIIDGVYVGGYENTQANGTSADETFKLGSGDDTIIFDISGAKSIGTNKVILSEGEKLTVTLTGDDSTTYTKTEKSGKDTIVNVFMTKSGFGITKLGSITFEDPYGKIHPDGIIIQGGNNIMKTLDLFAQTIDKSKAEKGQTIKGSFYNETIIGSKKADKIFTGAEDDEIDPNKGKDIITINGAGNKTINFDLRSGNNTIKYTSDGTDTKTTLQISDDSWHWDYKKVGKNLYLDTYYFDESKFKMKKTTQTLSNYFDLNDAQSSSLANKINIKRESYSNTDTIENNMHLVNVYGDNKRNVIGSHFNDNIYGSKKADKITTGIGVDHIYAGKGNDKIYLNSTGSKYIAINNGDGNDTVYVTNMTKISILPQTVRMILGMGNLLTKMI